MRDRSSSNAARVGLPRLLLAAVLACRRRARRMPSTSRSRPSHPTARAGCSRCAPAPRRSRARTGGRVVDQVLSRRRHGQRRAGAAQDPRRPAARRRVHGRRSRRAVWRAEPLRHSVAVPLARRDRCRAREARSGDDGGARAGRFRDASASSKAASRICSRTSRSSSVEDMRRKKVWVPEGDADQLPRHGGAGAFAGRAARDRRLDGAADGPHRHRVRFARRGAGAAVAHEGQVHHGRCRSPTRWASSRSRRTSSPALSAEDQQVVREVMGRYIQGSTVKRARTIARRRRCSRGPASQTVTVNAADVDGWRSTIEGLLSAAPRTSRHRCRHVRRLLAVLAEYRRTHP